MRILWLSDSPLTVTGFATISWNICNKLAEAGHEVYYIGHNYMGQPIPKGLVLQDGTKFNFTILGGSPRPYASDLLVPCIKKYKIDVFGILLDTFMCYPWLLGLDFSPAKTIFYYPSDGGGGMPLGCENILKKVNCPVAMSRFAQRQVKEIYNLDTKYIPHAIDVKNYYPLSYPVNLSLKSTKIFSVLNIHVTLKKLRDHIKGLIYEDGVWNRTKNGLSIIVDTNDLTGSVTSVTDILVTTALVAEK